MHANRNQVLLPRNLASEGGASELRHILIAALITQKDNLLNLTAAKRLTAKIAGQALAVEKLTETNRTHTLNSAVEKLTETNRTHTLNSGQKTIIR